MTSPDGTTIVFDLFPAAGRTGVLVIPGFWRTRSHPALRTLATRLSGSLVPSAVMDCRGHGESGGVFEFDRLERLDVAAVGRRLIDEAGLDRIVLLGLSAGGAVAISTAAHDQDLPICALLLVSPVAEFRRVVPRPNPFTMHRHLSLGQALARPRFRWPGADRLSPLHDAGRLAIPLCLIHARNDWLVSHHHSEAISRRAQSAEMHILDVPGRYHADKLFEVAGAQVWPIVDEFVSRFAGR